MELNLFYNKVITEGSPKCAESFQIWAEEDGAIREALSG